MPKQYDALILDCMGVIVTPHFPITEQSLIPSTLAFIQQCPIPLFVASTANTTTLRTLLKNVGVAQYFTQIYGGPTPKDDVIHTLLIEHNIPSTHTALIGDSMSDWDAAKANHIDFYGFNNPALQSAGAPYLNHWDTLILRP